MQVARVMRPPRGRDSNSDSHGCEPSALPPCYPTNFFPKQRHMMTTFRSLNKPSSLGSAMLPVVTYSNQFCDNNNYHMDHLLELLLIVL